ncbi:Threonine efflux protein, partial [Pseudomonas sp. FEN]
VHLPGGILDRCPDSPAGGGQPRPGLCRGGARERDPWSARRHLDRAGCRYGDFPACGLFAVGHRFDRVAIDRTVQCLEMAGGGVPAVHRLQGDPRQAGQARYRRPGFAERRAQRPRCLHFRFRDQWPEPQGHAVFPLAVHRGDQPAYALAGPGRLWRLPGSGHRAVVLPGGAAVQPAARACRFRAHGPLVRSHHGRGADRHRSKTGLHRDAL